MNEIFTYEKNVVWSFFLNFDFSKLSPSWKIQENFYFLRVHQVIVPKSLLYTNSKIANKNGNLLLLILHIPQP